MAYSIPAIRPVSTSVGKWTNKYNLENPIINANIIAAIPHFLLNIKTDTAAAMDAEVCPDGNDESNGSFIRRFCLIDSSYIKGLTLSNRFFIIPFVNISDNNNAPNDTTPIFLYFLENNKAKDNIIQNIPASPNVVTAIIILSSIGL